MKLSPLTIYIIGIALALPIIAFGLFFNKMPNDADTAAYETATAAYVAEAAKQRQADQRVAQAIAMVKQKEAQWRAYVGTRTPPTSVARGGINVATNSFQLSEDVRKYRNSIQRAVNNQLRKGGVSVISGPLVPIPDANAPANSLLNSFFNYQATGFPVVIFDLGAVTVQGNYNEIMNHVRAFKNMPNYLAVTDGLRLDGTSPNLTATYNLTIVGFIKSDVVYAQAPEGQASTQPGGGGFGGPPVGSRPGGAPGGGGAPSPAVAQSGPSAGG